MKEKFLEIYRKYINRPGSQDLLAYLEKSDFFEAPASNRFHLACPGGLVEHSIHVYERLRYLYATQISETITPEMEETIAICGLLHDLCKIDFYVPIKKSRKTGRTLPNGKPEWEDYMGYEIEDSLPYGHGEKSVYIISGFMRLSREEAMAIRWHMGFTDNNFKAGGYDVGNAFQMFPLAVLTHMADLLAAYFDEKEEKER